MPRRVPAWLLAYKLCGQPATPPPDKTLLIIGLEGGGLLVSHGHQLHSEGEEEGGEEEEEEEERANSNVKLYVFSAADLLSCIFR